MKSLVNTEPLVDLSSWAISRRLLYDDRVIMRADQYLHIDAIIDAIHEPVLILDKDLMIQSANKTFFQTFKATQEKVYGMNLAELSKRPSQINPLIKRLRKLSKNNASIKEYELTYPFEKVGERTLLINAKRITYDDRNSDIILLSIQDITQRKHIERQKDDFVGYITHELKTPITSLSVFIQLLERYHAKAGDKKSQFLIVKISGQLERLIKLLNSFTYVYKAQTGMLELQKEKIDLYEIVKETVETFQYTTSTHTISIEGNSTKPIFVDKERIRQVIINLLINAVKYSPNAKEIRVTFRQEQKNIVISVKDFGPGIPKEAQMRIFERFFRIQGGNQEYNVKGLGLGLYIALEIVKAHKGKLWVESDEGKGSVFSFSLPFQ